MHFKPLCKPIKIIPNIIFQDLITEHDLKSKCNFFLFIVSVLTFKKFVIFEYGTHLLSSSNMFTCSFTR